MAIYNVFEFLELLLNLYQRHFSTFSKRIFTECVFLIGLMCAVRLSMAFFIELAVVIEVAPMGVVHLGTLSAVSCHAVFIKLVLFISFPCSSSLCFSSFIYLFW